MLPVQVISYNVRYFSQPLSGLASTQRSLEAIAAALASLRPQIVCLQEVEERSLRSTLAWRHTGTQQAALVEALTAHGAPRYDGRYFPAHVAGRRARPLYTTGLSILVDDTFVIQSSDTIALGAARERRVCAHLSLRRRDDGSALHVFNAHLSLPSRPLRTRPGDGDNQLAQARILVDAVRERSGDDPFVLCGDFNATPGSATIAHVVEHATAAPCGDGPTAGFGPWRWRVDHLFAGNGVRWLDAEGTRAVDEVESAFFGLSDHAPLVARFAAY